MTDARFFFFILGPISGEPMESETGAADIWESRRVSKPTALPKLQPRDWGYEGTRTGFRHQGRFRVKAPGSGAIEQLTRELGAMAEVHSEAAGTLELAARTLEEQKAEIDALRVKLTHVKGSLSRHLAEVEASLEGGANGAPLTEQEREAVTMLQGAMLELADSLDAPETKAGDETGPF